MSAISSPTHTNTSKAETIISIDKIRNEAAKEALLLSFIVLVFGGFILVPLALAHLKNSFLMAAGACGGLLPFCTMGK
jgi:FtsH-binding integral membrane protein